MSSHARTYENGPGPTRSNARTDDGQVWVRDEFDLKVALRDDTIEKNSNLRYFTRNGTSYDRTPHVKVRDYTAHSQVGRIHFALDYDAGHLIVDHVGLKLY